LKKGNVFILSGLDNRVLILVPPTFKNSNIYVDEETAIVSNGNDCQIYLNQSIIDTLIQYFEGILNEEIVDDKVIKNRFELTNSKYLFVNIVTKLQIIDLYNDYFL
jgi:hypothetical protein